VEDKPDIKNIQALIRMAIAEDLGAGDLTSELFFDDSDVAKARIVSREEIIVCGMDVVREVLRCYDERLQLKVYKDDGSKVSAGGEIGVIVGPLRSMLSGERVMLNFLQRLSGIATETNKYVQAVEDMKAKIYDTRKTTPGWRILEKYAVRCGGGHNHRFGLYDGILIKDNHLAQLGEDFQGELPKIISDARNLKAVKFVAVEADNLTQLEKILAVKDIDIVLLDNMEIEQLKQAVEMRNKHYGEKPLLEASGKITLKNIAAVAASGVDRIAVGAITHSAAAVDIGLDR